MTHDSVHRPAHYAEGRIYEPIAVIEDWELNYRLGNAVKYISRAGRKQDALEDLKKARWYLDREIDQLELNQEPPTDYEQVLTFYGQTQDDPFAWAEPDGSGFDILLETDGFEAAQEVPFEWTDEDVLNFNHLKLNLEGNDGPVGSGGVDAFSATDFWSETPDYITGWDPSLGPVEISPEEIAERLSKKDLDQFEDDEIVSTVERRGMILGFRKDGSSCVLKNGRCE